MVQFKKISLKDCLVMVKEADEEKAFLPSKSDSGFSVEKFVSQGNDPGNYLFGTYDNGELVGFVATKTKEEGVLAIGPMYISKSHRGKGLGKIQVEKFIEWAQRENVKGIYTKTWGENAASLGVFKSLGFEILETEENARVNGDSTVKLFLKI